MMDKGRFGGKSWRQLLLSLAFAIGGVQTGSLVGHSPAPLACVSSDMCSIGKVKPYFGDILPSPALRSCLEARSYRREVILLTETRLNPAYQTFHNLLQLGYEHVVLLSTEDRCNKSAATWPRLACVWSSHPFISNTKYLLDRVAFMARGARLGYNILMLDSDVIAFRDVYGFLKGPLLANVTLAIMRDGNGWVNCGVVYIQNARSDGPAAYMLAEVVDRLERWAEEPQFYADRGLRPYCWDQQMYSDTLLTVLAGRPVSYGCWHKGDDGRQAEWDLAHKRLFGSTRVGPLETLDYLQKTTRLWPAELLTAAPDYPNREYTDRWTGILRVPNTQGVWPEELGGAFYPSQRGASSQLWLDVLQADVMPLWPDPEDSSQAAAAAAITETFAYLPVFLCETWSLGGGFGYWNAALRPPATPPPVAMAHFVHVPGGATNKLTVKMASGNWDWDIAHAVHPSRGVFFASTRAAPMPDVLALTREVEGREWSSEEEFAAATMALLRLAMEMGRAAAFPAPRCNVSWVGGADSNRLPLRASHAFYIPYARADQGFNDLRCLWAGYLQYGCQAVRWYYSGGLLAPEYDHLLQLLHQEGPDASSNSSGGAAAATAATAGKLEGLGFTPAAVAAATEPLRSPHGSGGDVGDGSRSYAHEQEVVVVPKELLMPLPPATDWDVSDLAAKLMQVYGGPGSGLLYGNATNAEDGSHGGAEGGGGSGDSSSGGADGGVRRPRVLVLSEVPRLSQKESPRHEFFKQELETGSDRHIMSCEWIRTGRPYRRRLERRRLLLAGGRQDRRGDSRQDGRGDSRQDGRMTSGLPLGSAQ